MLNNVFIRGIQIHIFQFPYKSKDQKYNLRSKQVPPEEPPNNRKAGVASRQTTRGPQQPPKRVPPPRPGAPSKKAHNANTVTLTETQLNNILETIGQLAVTNSELLQKSSGMSPLSAQRKIRGNIMMWKSLIQF